MLITNEHLPYIKHALNYLEKGYIDCTTMGVFMLLLQAGIEHQVQVGTLELIADSGFICPTFEPPEEHPGTGPRYGKKVTSIEHLHSCIRELHGAGLLDIDGCTEWNPHNDYDTYTFRLKA